MQTGPRQLDMQRLEKRELLAGDVYFGLSSGDARDVIIRGDNLANQIEVSSPAVGQVRVRGLNGTTVNGQSGFVTRTISDDLDIQMLGGNDRVDINGLRVIGQFHSDVSINMGSGSDNLSIINGTGNAPDVRRNLVINLGSGHDDMFLQNLDVGNNLSVVGGADNDDMSLLAVDVANELSMRGDAGRDDLLLRSVTAEDMFLFGGWDKDEVEIRDSDADDQMFVDLGAHDDVLRLFGNDAARPDFRGGSGSDHMIYGYNTQKNDFDPWGFRSSFEYRQRI